MHEFHSPGLKHNRRDRCGHGILPLMPELHERLAERVRDWRAAAYPSDRPAIVEVLELPARSKRIAVKITDMLGEELLLTAKD